MNKRIELERIADELLAGSLTNTEAELRTKALGRIDFGCDLDLDGEIDERIEERDTSLILKRKEQEIAYLNFYFDKDELNRSFLFIDLAESYEPHAGNFRKLFDKLEQIAVNKKADYISLTVDENNDNAINVYYHLGFENLGSISYESENVERFLMRKDLEIEE
ncbi:MAG: GNAT family N-acetyltransferase [Nanoarchaeota archaeon]|nr:GNAT family N-acetyltransferase [Nanoarchaeota archaeon]